jgi:hypothetical protein
MKIETTEAQVWWIAISDEIRPGAGVPLRNWMAALQEKFNFVQLPTALPAAGQGFDFRVGSLQVGETSINIALLSLYSDGITIQVTSNTRDAETVLQETLELFFSLGMREPRTSPLHYYVSTIIADFDKSLNSLLPKPILKEIADAMPVEGNAEFQAVYINFDQTKLSGQIAPLNPSHFRIERRAGVPYNYNRYFCQANTTTEKHIELLEQLERVV